MVLRLKIAVIGVFVVAVMAAAGAAQAWSPYVFGCYWPPYGHWSSRTYEIERLPYYAVYPPVYYSHPVSRPYGQSPFAAPPEERSPGHEEPIDGGPLVVVNPFAADEAGATPLESSSPKWLRIKNPFATDNAATDREKSAGKAEQK